MAEEIKQESKQEKEKVVGTPAAQQKAEKSAGAKKQSSAVVKDEPKKVFTQEELNAAVKAAVAEAMKNVPTQPTIVQVEKTEYVGMLFLGRFAEGTSVNLPIWGQITRTGETIDVPKKDFLRGLGKRTNKEFLRNRKLIVVDGIADDERKRFGLDYKEGEVLTQDAYYKLLLLPKDEVCRIYERLCPEHKELVARIFHAAYFEERRKDIPLETVKALNDISKSICPDGLFRRILKSQAEELID